ncbi:MAG TPA: PilZ domain-containing protein [Gemmatimonadales bacterium]|nr:PilZ domain-containing protein [Gemmatimonadales bacterium]
MSEYEFEREHYRIEYPTAARPRFLVDGSQREVMNVSEQGLRYRAADDERRVLGDEVEGIVRFRRGEEVRVVGTVVRLVDREVALRLSVGVPLRAVLEEQRYLRERHRGSAR